MKKNYFSKVIAEATKAKQNVISDMAKVDEKYKALAEKEKVELKKALKVLESQLSALSLLSGEEKTEEEPVVVDTIFPENNTPEPAEEETTVEEAPVVEESVEEPVAEEKVEEEIGFTEVVHVEDTTTEEPEAVLEEILEEEDAFDWPEQPEEWN